jgi:hypothetical protein
MLRRPMLRVPCAVRQGSLPWLGSQQLLRRLYSSRRLALARWALVLLPLLVLHACASASLLA